VGLHALPLQALVEALASALFVATLCLGLLTWKGVLGGNFGSIF